MMKRSLLSAAIAATLLVPATTSAADSTDMAEVKRLIEQMKADYEEKIEALEQRLRAAEQKAETAADAAETAKQASAAPPYERESSGRGAVTSGTAFNPEVSVILDGNYYHDGVDGEGTEITANAFQPSHTHGHGEEGDHGGHAHGSTEQGFNFREAEIVFSAAVDPYFDATARLAISGDGDVDLEEAWFQTRSLSQGLKLKGGKFLSDFGYINRQHPHQWDFTDQNLVYENLLGDHGLQDTGLQLTWLPNLPVYTLFGAELLQGDQERFGAFVDDGDEREETGLGDRKDGPRLWTVFAKVAPELGYDHALQLGASFAHNRQHQEIHEHDMFENGLAGDADLWGLDLVYKHDGEGSYGHRDFKLQSEYLHSIKDLKVRGGDPDEIGSKRKFTTDGLYAQALFGFFPRWQAGLRYDVFGLTNKVSGGENESFGSSDRWTAALTYTPTEFSRFRLQYAYNDILTEPGNRETFSTVWLQFLMSLGTHGAHRF